MSRGPKIPLVDYYADANDMDYQEAMVLLMEEAESHDNAQEFLDDIGMSHQFLYDARFLMDEAQR